MKIGFIFEDKGFENMIFEDPFSGNAGVGGTQYEFLLLAYSLQAYHGYDVTMYHFNKNDFPCGIRDVIVDDYMSAITCSKENNDEFLVFWTDGNSKLVELVNQCKVNGILWAHNNLTGDVVKAATKSDYIKRVVFVGQEEYDRYIDDDIIKKSVMIYNIFDSFRFSKREFVKDNNVVFMGSLVPDKGFHVLASVWKEVVNECPDANLYVIGSGKLYNRNNSLGDLGIAEKRYEDKFANYILENNQVMPSVHFMGTLGKEKLEILKKAKVGVINPTGKSETFGISAIEMEALGIPVIGAKKNGLFDTIIDGKTGYLIANKTQLKKRIISLLLNDEKNKQFGENAKVFADSMFSSADISSKWNEMFIKAQNGIKQDYIKPSKHILNNGKILRILNRQVRKVFYFMPSSIRLEYFCRRMIGK